MNEREANEILDHAYSDAYGYHSQKVEAEIHLKELEEKRKKKHEKKN